jgi:hypothetical protein
MSLDMTKVVRQLTQGPTLELNQRSEPLGLHQHLSELLAVTTPSAPTELETVVQALTPEIAKDPEQYAIDQLMRINYQALAIFNSTPMATRKPESAPTVHQTWSAILFLRRIWRKYGDYHAHPPPHLPVGCHSSVDTTPLDAKFTDTAGPQPFEARQVFKPMDGTPDASAQQQPPQQPPMGPPPGWRAIKNQRDLAGVLTLVRSNLPLEKLQVLYTSE